MAGEGRTRGRAAAKVPADLRRLWRMGGASRRGRPAELDVGRVVQAAVGLADREGLPGASLPRIAEELGCSAMALYRHVGSKGALLSLMRDAAVGSPPDIASTPAEWRKGLRQWAHADRLLHQRRPWLARLPIEGPPLGPNEVAWMEAGLRVLRGTRLDGAEKLGLLMLISGYVRQATFLAQDLERGRKGTGLDKARAEELYARSLKALIDPARFPETARLLSSNVFESHPGRASHDPTSDPDFVFGLERILDGAAVAIARARRAR